MKQVYAAAYSAMLLLAQAGWAQTTIDLSRQSRSVDFAAASSTRPMKTGTVLPAVCSTGDMFFKTDAPLGANLYGCVATNNWAVESGGAGGGEANTGSNQGAAGVGVFLQKSGTVLQFKNVNAASSRVSVTNDAANNEIDLDVAPANLDLATIGGALAASQIAGTSRQGTGTKVQMFGGGTPAANHCAKFDGNGNVVSAGAACGTGGGGGGSLTGGSGIDNDQLTGGVVAVDTATVPTFLTASANLDFGSLSQSNCEEKTIAMPGAGTADSVAPGWPHSLEQGFLGMMFVSNPGVVTVRLCRITSGSANPATQSFRATIVRGF